MIQVDEDFHRFQQEPSTESFQLFLFPTDAPSISRRFGLDDRILEARPEFRGVLLPTGPHFFLFEVDGNERIGFFVWFDRNTIFAPVFDEQTKRFDTRQSWRTDNPLPVINELEDALIDYGEPSDRWERLTGRITSKFLNGVFPTRSGGQLAENLHFFSMSREFECAQKCKQLNVKVADVQRWAIENGEYREESGFHLNFTHIPFLLPKEDNSGGLTDLLDREVDIVDHLHVLKRFNYDQTAFGEMEYAFVISYFGHVAAGVDQWSRLVHFFCLLSGEAANFTHCYSTFVSVLKAQLEVMRPTFFAKHVVRWVTRALPMIKKNLVDNEKLSARLRTHATELHRLLVDKFGLVSD